jgi:hypothetical protein
MPIAISSSGAVPVPEKAQHITAVHEGAGSLNVATLLDDSSLSTNLLFWHRGVIAPHSGIGEHFHNHCEEMFVILSRFCRVITGGDAGRAARPSSPSTAAPPCFQRRSAPPAVSAVYKAQTSATVFTDTLSYHRIVCIGLLRRNHLFHAASPAGDARWDSNNLRKRLFHSSWRLRCLKRVTFAEERRHDVSFPPVTASLCRHTERLEGDRERPNRRHQALGSHH